MQENPSDRFTFRIRGVPLDWNKSRLRTCLEQYDPDSHPAIKSIALEVDRCTYSATVVFKNLSLLTRGPQPWRIPLETSSPDSGYLSIDNDFLGVTTLYTPSPRDHKVDMIALGDIGGHPLESYEEVASNHLWLRDILPAQLIDSDSHQPMARIMTYGYKSLLERNDGFASFEDSGKALLKSLAAFSNSSNIKPIILIGHGVGGLVVKQAIISLSKLQGETDTALFRAIRGVVFFGVPHDGMNITSLQEIIKDSPNRLLVESLCQGGSELIKGMHDEFMEALDQKSETEIFSFYGTLESSIAQQGSPRVGILVTRASATYCHPGEDGQHTCAIPRTNADMAKFEPHDPEYGNVGNRLLELSLRASNLGVAR